MKDELSNLLSEWGETVPTCEGFNRDVWAKIEAASASSGWFERMLNAIARPRVAVALAAAAIACGILAGTMLSHESGPDMYLRSVNPYAMNR